MAVTWSSCRASQPQFTRVAPDGEGWDAECTWLDGQAMAGGCQTQAQNQSRLWSGHSVAQGLSGITNVPFRLGS